ncbi:MAG: AIPR family protein [Desulfovibrionaceae bacterium]|nr:AIPR family protein [Desulfovibrionaceae bacterium]
MNLELGFHGLGYCYIRKSGEIIKNEIKNFNHITSVQVAEAVLAIWRKKPHQAKFLQREFFGNLYFEIFNNLNSAQAILAVLILRYTEVMKDKRDVDSDDFIPYASYYISMCIGMKILEKNKISLDDIDHRNFEEIKNFFGINRDSLYEKSKEMIIDALAECYGKRKISLQQLSATFRRGDLLNFKSLQCEKNGN